MAEQLVRAETLSTEAHAALWFAMASLPENHPRWLDPVMPRRAYVLREYQRGLDGVKESGFPLSRWKEALKKGLVELAEHRLVVLGTDGHAGYEVKDVFFGQIEGGKILLTE